LIVLLVRGQGWDEIVAAFKQISFSQILFAFLFVLLSRFCVILRWYILLRSGWRPRLFSEASPSPSPACFSSNSYRPPLAVMWFAWPGAIQLGYDRAVSLASLVADRLIGALSMLLFYLSA